MYKANIIIHKEPLINSVWGPPFNVAPLTGKLLLLDKSGCKHFSITSPLTIISLWLLLTSRAVFGWPIFYWQVTAWGSMKSTRSPYNSEPEKIYSERLFFKWITLNGTGVKRCMWFAIYFYKWFRSVRIFQIKLHFDFPQACIQSNFIFMFQFFVSWNG